jgi:hypothetical protein
MVSCELRFYRRVTINQVYDTKTNNKNHQNALKTHPVPKLGKRRELHSKEKLNHKAPFMSDFPKGGDISSTRAWLDNKGFIGFFVGWKADAILGLSEKKIMDRVPGERGEMLWGFLNTARQTTGKTIIICSSFILLHLVFVFSCVILSSILFLLK